MIKILKAHRQLGFHMVLLTFVWKCFQDRNFLGVVVGPYEHSNATHLTGTFIAPVNGVTYNIVK